MKPPASAKIAPSSSDSEICFARCIKACPPIALSNQINQTYPSATTMTRVRLNCLPFLGHKWSGYDELDTKLRVRGVQDDPKKKAIRQAVQGLGGKGGPLARSRIGAQFKRLPSRSCGEIRAVWGVLRRQAVHIPPQPVVRITVKFSLFSLSLGWGEAKQGAFRRNTGHRKKLSSQSFVFSRLPR